MKKIKEIKFENTGYVGIVYLIKSDGEQFLVLSHQIPVAKEFAERLATFMVLPLVEVNTKE